jgi:hypothetical protein
MRLSVGSLSIPDLLIVLIEAGRWPRDGSAAKVQNLQSPFSAPVIQTFAPEERTIYLYAPPFHTIREEVEGGHGLSAEQLAVREIAPELTVPVDDFGLGSDTVLALDFRSAPSQPSVIRLQWRLPNEPNRWVKVADDFAAFWKMLDVA